MKELNLSENQMSWTNIRSNASQQTADLGRNYVFIDAVAALFT